MPKPSSAPVPSLTLQHMRMPPKDKRGNVLIAWENQNKTRRQQQRERIQAESEKVFFHNLPRVSAERSRFRMSTTGSSSSTTTTTTAAALPRVRVPRTPPGSALAGSVMMHNSGSASVGAQDEDSDSDTASTTTPKPGPSSSPAAESALKLKHLLARPPAPPAEQKTDSVRTPSEHESDFELDSEEGRSAFRTPRANGRDHRESLKELFSSASRPPGDSPLKRRPRAGSLAEEGSPKPDIRGRSASDDDNEREKSSSMSLQFAKSGSFDLLRDSMHVPDFDTETSDSISRTDTPPRAPPLALPPSPDSPRPPPSEHRRIFDFRGTSLSGSPANSHLMSLETPRPLKPPQRPVSPIASTSTSFPTSMFDSVVNGRRLSKQPSPEPAHLLPVELTTPTPNRGSSIAAEIAWQKAEQRQQQKTPVRQPDPPPPQTPIQEQDNAVASSSSAVAATLAAEPPTTPYFPGHLRGTTPRQPRGGRFGHQRSPTIGSAAEWEEFNIPSNASGSRPSPLADTSNNHRAHSFPQAKDSPIPKTPAPPGYYPVTPALAKGTGKGKTVRWHPDIDASASADESRLATPSKQPVTVVASPHGVRLMDEYGRPRKFAEDGSEIVMKPPSGGTPVKQRPTSPDESRDKQHLPTAQVDRRAAGQAASQVKQELSPGLSVSRRRPQPADWEAIQRGLRELNSELDAESKRAGAANTQLSTPSDSSTETPARLSDLADRSRRARAKRDKLRSRVDSAYDAMRGWIKLPLLLNRRPAVIWMALLLTLLLWVVFRLAQARALYIYSYAYLDPLHPSVYQYSGQAQWLARPLPAAWAPFTVAGGGAGQGPHETFVGFLLRWLLPADPPARTWVPS
ncbi:hypothetical protein AURDEDRAFT_181190 [Auricularia subglabra TFB-10046 SS5]|nr:hypothetical protein AURDEDRAFT_181190 [Auricularia subglabra TFB-10046 SS5]